MVEVERAAAAYPLTFRNHVMPVLTKVGCNSGPCHGALAGKNGFKLTLRGYDPEADYLTLTRQAAARRVNTVEPGQKPDAAQADARGFARRRPAVFDRAPPSIASSRNGSPPASPAPSDSDPVMTHLEVFPSAAHG